MDLAKTGPGNALEHSVQVGRLYENDAKLSLLEWVKLVGTTYGLTELEAEEFVKLYGKLIEVRPEFKAHAFKPGWFARQLNAIGRGKRSQS